MNDIEKQIEGIEEDNSKEIYEGDDNIKVGLNYNGGDKNKKNILYLIIGVLVFFLVVLIVYIFINNNSNDDSNISNNGDDVVNGELDDVVNQESTNIGYVSCDDNTALLNVRNSINGNIIDGISCYKEVVIDEILDGTDNCNTWYKISYDKNNKSYTGYACGTYIKNLDISKTVLEDIRKIVDKAIDYYDESILKAYCGNGLETKIIDFGNNMTGEYIKSEYKSLDELKNYLLSFLDERLIDVKLELSDINNPKYYDNYYEIDGNLYCRNYSGTGINSYYTGNYDIEVISYTDNKTIVNIAYQYINKDSGCSLDNISSCKRNDFVYDIGKINIENGIIKKMDFYK